MKTLDLSPRLSDPDELFEALVDAHQGLSPEASRRLDARLVLLLANHIGDADVLRQAIAAAIGGAAPDPARREERAFGTTALPWTHQGP